MKISDIYRRDYWDKNKVDEMFEQLRHIYFDMCVNQGKGTSSQSFTKYCNSKRKRS